MAIMRRMISITTVQVAPTDTITMYGTPSTGTTVIGVVGDIVVCSTVNSAPLNVN